jgi:hypothetical protein
LREDTMTIITTIRDAERVIDDWTANYLRRPGGWQTHRAARALVDHIGGYGHELTPELSDSFDLDYYLYEED